MSYQDVKDKLHHGHRKVSACDYGHETRLPVKRLDLGGNSGVFLCPYHWRMEMVWRGLRNEMLEPQNRFAILPFPRLMELK